MRDLVEDRVHDVFDVAQIKMRITFCDALNEFRLDHFFAPMK